MWAASARLRGYDQVLCEAFVLPEREVWWLENIETGEREFVFREEKLARLGEEDKSQALADEGEQDKPAEGAAKADTAPADAKPPVRWKLVESYHDALLDMEVDTIQPVVASNQLLEIPAQTE